MRFSRSIARKAAFREAVADGGEVGAAVEPEFQGRGVELVAEYKGYQDLAPGHLYQHHEGEEGEEEFWEFHGIFMVKGRC